MEVRMIGTPKTGTDELAEEDMLEVTAGNGVNVVTYTIELSYVGVNDPSGEGLRIYPNPATGLFYVEGAELGARIRVYNPVGVMLQETLVSGTEVISLEDQPNGMYFITISNGDKVLNHTKLIKQ
jgi:hypothetical protein